MKTRCFPRALMSSAAFFAALAASGHAGAVPMPGACPDQTTESRTSAVIGASEDLGGGAWQYRYRVCNTSFDFYGEFGSIMIDWELPYFDDAGIRNVVTPEGWNWSIEQVGVANPVTGWGMTDNDNDGDVDDDDAIPLWTVDGDPWKEIFDTAYGSAAANPFNAVEQVLHFYFDGRLEAASTDEPNGQVEPTFFCDFIFPGEECEGFGFDADFGPGDAPYQASWLDEPVQTGDPAFPLNDQTGGGIPNSPSIQRQTNDVPEPGTLALAALAAPAAGLAVRRRRARR